MTEEMGQTPRPPDALSTLEGRMEVMKREIDALQIEVMKGRGPWYKQVPVVVPVVVAVAALAFSFATTYISERRIDQQERHETRVELRELVQRLSELPKENFLLNRKYANDPGAQAFLGGLVNTENLVLGSQAANLISRLPTEVTASEYYAVAWAQYQSGQPASEPLLNQGIEVARANPTKDFPGFLALLRHRANLYFTLDKPEAGRRIMQEAVDATNRYVRGNPYLFANSQISTENSWAFAELSMGNCDEARRHNDSAQEYLAKTTLPTLHAQVRTRAKAIDTACPPAGAAKNGVSPP